MSEYILYKKGYENILQITATFQTNINYTFKPEKYFNDSIVDAGYFRINYNNGVVTVMAKYAWDGASGPVPNTDSTQRASLLHDVLYQAIRLGYLKQEFKNEADMHFKRILIEDGMPWIFAQSCYLGLRAFGKSSTLPEAEPKVLRAPKNGWGIL